MLEQLTSIFADPAAGKKCSRRRRRGALNQSDELRLAYTALSANELDEWLGKNKPTPRRPSEAVGL